MKALEEWKNYSGLLQAYNDARVVAWNNYASELITQVQALNQEVSELKQQLQAQGQGHGDVPILSAKSKTGKSKGNTKGNNGNNKGKGKSEGDGGGGDGDDDDAVDAAVGSAREEAQQETAQAPPYYYCLGSPRRVDIAESALGSTWR